MVGAVPLLCLYDSVLWTGTNLPLLISKLTELHNFQ